MGPEGSAENFRQHPPPPFFFLILDPPLLCAISIKYLAGFLIVHSLYRSNRKGLAST